LCVLFLLRILATNFDYFPIRHHLVGFYNQDGVSCAVRTGCLNDVGVIPVFEGLPVNCEVRERENLIACHRQPFYSDAFTSVGCTRNARTCIQGITSTCIQGTTSTSLQILVSVGNQTHFLGVTPCSPVTTPTVLYLIYITHKFPPHTNHNASPLHRTYTLNCLGQ